jgi:Protein of unknown function (DUF3152)
MPPCPRPTSPAAPGRPAARRRLARVATFGLTLALVAAGATATASAAIPAGAGGVQTRIAPEVAATAASSAARRAPAAAQRVTVAAPSAARTGTVIRFRGTVSPARAGLAVRLQRRYGGQWHTVARTQLTASGTWSASVRTPGGRAWLRYRAVASRNGALPARAVEARRVDNYTRHTYVVRTRGNITVSTKTFAAQAAETYAEPRGWRRGHHRFVRLSKGGDFTLVLAEAKYLPTYSSVCSTKYSCRVGRYVIINQDRWRSGSAPFTGSLRNYRHMVVNHETGHWLGRHHEHCGGRDQLAPVMQQQSKTLEACKPNSWPLAFEIRAVT